MAEEVSITGLRATQQARRAGLMAWVQSIVIFLLLVAVAEDYDQNQYFQAWAGTHLGGLGFLLNGMLAAFYAGILVTLFVKGPLPYAVFRRIRRREAAVPASVLRFYEEIAILTSEPRNQMATTSRK
jgi:hypothetical protein